MNKLLLLAVILLTSCGSLPLAQSGPTATPTITPIPPTSTPLPFAVNVDGTGISPSEFGEELARYQDMLASQGISKSEDEIKTIVADELTTLLILRNGAIAEGYTPSPEDIQTRIQAIISALGGQESFDLWLEKNHYDTESFIKAIERNTAAAWMRDKIAMDTPKVAEQVHIQQMLLYDEDSANYYFGQLNAGVDFDFLASQIDPVTRGDIGWFPKGYIPDTTIESAAFGLQPGDTSALIKGNVGWYILLCLERSTDRELTPDALAVMQKKQISTWVEQQKSTARILVNP